MKRPIVEILREHNLTYMREGKEVVNYTEQKDGKMCHSRIVVPQTLEIEDGYEYLGKTFVDKYDRYEERNGFARPRGACVTLNLCECMFSNNKPLFVDIDQHIEEMKERVYIGILLTVCKHHILTDGKIQIGVEWLGHFVYVKGWIMTD